MSKKLQLTIPKPCHENWDAMTPVEKGKFCGSCQKQVVDFSNMSDRLVAEFFKKPSTGSVCGRFMTDQLDRSIEIPKKRIPWVKYFFQFAIPAFLISIKASAQKTQGKIKVNTTVADTAKVPFPNQIIRMGTAVARPICTKPLMGDIMITPIKKPLVDKIVKGDTILLPGVVVTAVKNEILMGKVSNYPVVRVDTSVIKGKVVDEKGEPLPGVAVIIKGTRSGVAADINGNFSIIAKPQDILLASGPGLEPTEVLVGNNKVISMVVKRVTLSSVGEIVVGTPAVKRIKKSTKLVPRLIPDISTKNSSIAFKVFPNPVSSGTNLNIELKQTEEGYYSVQLLNQSGQSVHQQEIWIDAEARLLSIDVPNVAAGSYFLSLTNKKSGKRFTEKIIIQ
jgi:CarboxypepD_reg-like domain/Secretion system C-terminal sorting domain